MGYLDKLLEEVDEMSDYDAGMTAIYGVLLIAIVLAGLYVISTAT